jgi:hypothetical protein
MNLITQRVYWQATALLLTAHFGGWPHGLAFALGLNVVQVVHFLAVRRTLRALDVQVRCLYLAVLILGLWPPLGALHVLQLAGLVALLVADYCLAARMLVLMPWNRNVPLSTALVRWVLLSPPAPGSIADRMRAAGLAGPRSTGRAFEAR